VGGGVAGQRLAEGRADLVAGAGPPAHLPRVRQEDDRPDDTVGQRAAVAEQEIYYVSRLSER
jgi:hypothetical protein